MLSEVIEDPALNEREYLLKRSKELYEMPLDELRNKARELIDEKRQIHDDKIKKEHYVNKYLGALLFVIILAGCTKTQNTYYYSDANGVQQEMTPETNAKLNAMQVPTQINQELVKEYSGAVRDEHGTH